MTIPFKKAPPEYDQRVLFPTNIFDLLPEDHDCIVYSELFCHLDTSKLEASFSTRGQNAYHPKKIVSILIYAYSQGVFSSRQIQKKCSEDLGFMFIAQMNCPNFRVLSDFRKNNNEFFHSCFKQTVMLAMETGLASLGHVSLDGSKFKANTSKHKAMSYKRLKEREAELTKEIEALVAKAKACDHEENIEYEQQTGYELPEDLRFKEKRLRKIKAAKAALEKRERKQNPNRAIDDKKQISFADHDARIMGKNNFAYSYNGQISVDKDHQIIVGQHLTQQASDVQEVGRALSDIKEATGRLPDKASFDNGYFSGPNLAALESHEIDAYVSCGKGEQQIASPDEIGEGLLKRSNFIYIPQEDCFQCPRRKKLTLVRQDNDGLRYYRSSKEACLGCDLWERCSASKIGRPRTLKRDSHEELRTQMREKMTTEEAKAIYKLRKQIVEPVFGQIKNLGFRGFSVRGLEGVSGEFSLMCSVHNIRKMVKHVFRAKVCPMAKGFS